MISITILPKDCNHLKRFENMHELLKEKVLEANLALVKHDLVIFTWGNASERDPETGHIVIKPSGVPYDRMKADQMVVLDADGKQIEGELRPSSDAPTHVVLYRQFKEHRRSGPYPFRVGHFVGPGRKDSATLRDHTCRLFLRGDSLHQAAYPGGD